MSPAAARYLLVMYLVAIAAGIFFGRWVYAGISS